MIIGRRAKDGGQPCGHEAEDHERHKDGAFVYYVCRACRAAGQAWTKELENKAAGADHWYNDGYRGTRAQWPVKEDAHAVT